MQNMEAASHMLLISETQRTGKCSQMGGDHGFPKCLCACIALSVLGSVALTNYFLLQRGNHGANSTSTVTASHPVQPHHRDHAATIPELMQLTSCRDPCYFWVFSASLSSRSRNLTLLQPFLLHLIVLQGAHSTYP